MVERSFGSLADFALHLSAMTAQNSESHHDALERAAVLVETTAKQSIGTYDLGWAPLAETTKADRVAKGFPADEPLLRDGKLRDSITHSVGRDEARVGSNSDVAVWQELGTSRMPPRSFLLQSAVSKEREVVAILGGGCIKGIVTSR